MLRIGCMAIGGIGAYYLYKLDMRILRPIYAPITQILTLVVVIAMMFLGVEIPYITHEFYSVLFLIIILNLAANPKSLISFENKILDYLGKISYSIYMWHNVAIIIGFYIARMYNSQLDNFFSNAIYYGVTFVFTLVLSTASYELYEKQFLKFKHLFAKVQSGNSN